MLKGSVGCYLVQETRRFAGHWLNGAPDLHGLIVGIPASGVQGHIRTNGKLLCRQKDVNVLTVHHSLQNCARYLLPTTPSCTFNTIHCVHGYLHIK